MRKQETIGAEGKNVLEGQFYFKEFYCLTRKHFERNKLQDV